MAGILYRYTYERDGKQWTISVWNRDWLNDKRVTGIEKVEYRTNEKGQKVKITTTTRIEERNFTDIAKDLV